MSEKIELKDKLAAVDLGAKSLWDELDATQQKALKSELFILNRYISNAANQKREIQEHFVLAVNEYFNKHWNTLQKHPKLLWQLLCMCSHESRKTQFHEWIPLKREKNKKEEFLAELFPNMKRADIETLAAVTTDKEIKQYCESLGWDKKEINAIKF